MKMRKLKVLINKRQDNTTPRRDKDCELCHGERGGVAGNNNIIDGIVMCDYCHVRYDDAKAYLKNNPLKLGILNE